MDKRTKQPIVHIYKDKVTQIAKGDATVSYADADGAAGAINWFDGKVFEGTKNVLKVEMAVNKPPPPGGWPVRGRGRGRGRY